MKIENISIERSRVNPSERILTVEIAGRKSVGYFDDFNAFVRAVSGALMFHAAAAGIIKIDPKTKQAITMVKR